MLVNISLVRGPCWVALSGAEWRLWHQMLSKEHKKKPLNEMKIHGLTEISNMRLEQKLIFDALIIWVGQSGNISAEYIDVIGSGIRSLIEILFISLL